MFDQEKCIDLLRKNSLSGNFHINSDRIDIVTKKMKEEDINFLVDNYLLVLYETRRVKINSTRIILNVL